MQGREFLIFWGLMVMMLKCEWIDEGSRFSIYDRPEIVPDLGLFGPHTRMLTC